MIFFRLKFFKELILSFKTFHCSMIFKTILLVELLKSVSANFSQK